MKLVFINHCHPDTPHICAVRARELASAMAKRGHQVVLLTQTQEPGIKSAISVQNLGSVLRQHDFDEVLNLAVHPTAISRLNTLRHPDTRSVTRRAIIGWHYLVHTGVFTDWQTGARRYIDALADEFQPDLVWATFGNTDCWNIARDIAHKAHCPWVGDHKDFWSTFIPAPFRRLVANRYRKQKIWTALSDTNAKEAARWFDGQITTVYSGVPDSWAMPAQPTPPPEYQISLTGGLYEGAAVTVLIKSLQALKFGTSGKALRIVYAGNDGDRFLDAAKHLSPNIEVENLGYLPLEELRNLYQSSTANLYLKSDRTFHHKVYELLAVGRPIVCIPGEQTEARTLADRNNVSLYSCANPNEFQIAMDEILACASNPTQEGPSDFPFTWSRQAQVLEQTLSHARANYS